MSKIKLNDPAAAEACGEVGTVADAPQPMPLAGVLVALCFEVRNQAHVAHLGAQGDGSYAKHMALDEFYNDIIGAADAYAENWQGRYGLMTIGMHEASIPRDNVPIEAVIAALRDWIDQNRAKCGAESELQNLIDNIQSICNKAIYKLTYLH